MAPRHGFRGKSAPRRRSKSGFSQASTRRAATAYDQHGRPWHMSLENKNGRPVGLIVPGFAAPWIPDQQHLRTNPDNVAELYIDYAAILRPRRVRAEEFHALAVQAAQDKQLPAPPKGQYSQQLLNVIGKPPKPIELVIAAMQENPYILGETDVADPRLLPFLDTSSFEDVIDSFDFGPRSFAEVQAENTAPRRAPKPPLDPVAVTTEHTAVEEFDAIDPLLGADASTGTIDELLDDLGDEVPADVGDLLGEGLSDGLDEEFDAAATGGKRVAPQKTAIAAKQAPRRPGQSVRKGARAKQQGKRPSLADGARPVIGD